MAIGYRRSGRSGRRIVITLFVFALILSGLASSLQPTAAQESEAEGVEILTGSYVVENPLQLSTTSEPYMLLLDMTAFIKRDLTYHAPVESQVIAPLLGDLAEGAEFRLSLPVQPQGEYNVIGQSEGEGVQVFSLEFSANRVGDPFLGRLEGGGWGTAQSSLEVSDGYWEVIGGRVIVWSPDDEREFSTGFGEDGLFLTEDDPVEPIEAGWTVIDLNDEPFERIRDTEVQIEILPGNDQYTDLSDLGMVESFDALIEELRVIYAFTDYRDIDFDALVEEYRPRIEEAEANDDFEAYQRAIYEFSLEFNDGHVSTVPPEGFITEHIGGRLGMRVKETDDGDFIVVGVAEGLPADQAGIEPGALILEWDGGSVEDAIAAEPLIISESSPTRRRMQAFEFLTRGPLGETVEVTFQNPGGEEETVELTYSEDVDGADVALNTRLGNQVDDADSLPISAELLPSGVGYIRVNSFLVDPVMFTTSWDYAVENLLALEAQGFIIDVRDNGGGYGDLALYMASTFYDEEFELSTTYWPDGEGGFVPSYVDRIIPNGFNLTDFPVAVLTDIDCASACEIFTGAMAVDPENLIVSFTPTAGVEAGVYLWTLAGDLPFQASFIRLEMDGEVYLEGVGVPPNVRIPSTPENLILTDEDVELTHAEEAVLAQIAGEDPRNVEPGEPTAEEADEVAAATPEADDETPTTEDDEEDSTPEAAREPAA